jgi:hypothetical protein
LQGIVSICAVRQAIQLREEGFQVIVADRSAFALQQIDRAFYQRRLAQTGGFGQGNPVRGTRQGARVTNPTLPGASSGLPGHWDWVGDQTLEISANGTFEVFRGLVKINEGKWVSLGGAQFRLTHHKGGWVDTVNLSADANVIDGFNNQGNPVRGTRQGARVTNPTLPGAAEGLPGRWNWVGDQTLEISANGTFEVFRGLLKINEGKWVSLGGAQFRLTHYTGGWVDTITLSTDGKTISGTNNRGNPVRGTRR